MKTPFDVLLKAAGYWVLVFIALLIPRVVNNYYVNLISLTVIIPNMLRFIVGQVPQLAVDRMFFLLSTVFALILTYMANKIWKDTANSIEKTPNDRRKIIELTTLLMITFVMGFLITYYSGIDKSIYSNMGWESNA